LLPDNEPLEGLSAKSKTELRRVLAELLLDLARSKGKEADRDQ